MAKVLHPVDSRRQSYAPRLLNGDMRHRSRGRGSVPMLLFWGNLFREGPLEVFLDLQIE